MVTNTQAASYSTFNLSKEAMMLNWILAGLGVIGVLILIFLAIGFVLCVKYGTWTP